MSAVDDVIAELGDTQRAITKSQTKLRDLNAEVSAEEGRLNKLEDTLSYLKLTLVAVSLEVDAEKVGVPVDQDVQSDYFRRTLSRKSRLGASREEIDEILESIGRDMMSASEVRARFFATHTDLEPFEVVRPQQ